jgi:aspartate aminotransferase
LQGIADLIRGKDVAVFSDEPYDRMVWRGRHHSLLELPGMLEQTVAAYTFSKSFSMSGWRLGFAVSSPEIIEVFGKLTNSAISCVPPFTQMAGVVAMREELGYRDAKMKEFQKKVELLVAGMNKIDGVSCAMPGGTFYVFPSVAAVCNRLGITSHGLALFLLEGADDKRGVACLGGECFGEAGRGFFRLSCAQPDDRIAEAFAFMAEAFKRTDRVQAYLKQHPEFRLSEKYEETPERVQSR